MAMSGNFDRDFATLMSMPHAQAIKMIDVYRKHGRSAELRAMALKMKTEQEKEIKPSPPFAK